MASEVEYRAVPGFPRYRVGSDRSIRLGGRFVPVYRSGDGPPYVMLRRESGRPVARPVELLHLSAFGPSEAPPEPPPAPPIPEELPLPSARPPIEPDAPPPSPPAIAVPLPSGRFTGERQARGSRHGRAMLDEAKVIEARRLRREGWTYPELSRRYGVGRMTLWYAITGRTWSHVPMDP